MEFKLGFGLICFSIESSNFVFRAIGINMLLRDTWAALLMQESIMVEPGTQHDSDLQKALSMIL
jgi:hypothetical protein